MVYTEKERNNGEVMTTTEVAHFLKVSVGAVRRWSRNGNLKGYRLGGYGSWRYLRKDVLNFMLGGTNR